MAKEKELNLDPITREPGSHPLGTGLGAAAGGAAVGAVAGAIAGPAGAVIGGLLGAVAGGLGGKGAAEAINPTAEEAWWENNYHREPYYEDGRAFTDYGPAYRLGLFGYNEYSGSFEQMESRLATHWDTGREGSTLEWAQARDASRAAWDRADSQQSGAQRDDDLAGVLNDLLETCRDGEYGFRECADHVKSQDIKILLDRRAEDCRNAGFELLNLITELGGKPDDGGTAAGALHRGWVSLRGTLGRNSDEDMLNECERGEDVALAHYRKALNMELTASTRSVIERQAQGAQRNHDQVKALRDAIRAAH